MITILRWVSNLNPDCPLAPFAVSLSKGREGFDKLSPNGIFPMDNLG